MLETGSPSLAAPTYWWYVARARLLEAAVGHFATDARRVLDVGSADGPSVAWLEASERKVSLDIDPRGLDAGGICGSVTNLPFASESFDLVSAFDVVEHCDPEADALSEIHRVLRPGGIMLMSVPAYQWAWTSFDVDNRHFRRYTKKRAKSAVEAAGFTVLRSTYLFSATFPLFAISRLGQRLAESRRTTSESSDNQLPSLPEVGATTERALLGLTGVDQRMLRRTDLPFGSSVVVAAQRPPADSVGRGSL